MIILIFTRILTLYDMWVEAKDWDHMVILIEIWYLGYRRNYHTCIESLKVSLIDTIVDEMTSFNPQSSHKRSKIQKLIGEIKNWYKLQEKNLKAGGWNWAHKIIPSIHQGYRFWHNRDYWFLKMMQRCANIRNGYRFYVAFSVLNRVFGSQF